MRARERTCGTCHTEHHGRTWNLIQWPRGNPQNFDHERAGFPLQGAHRDIDCTACHQRKRIKNADVATLLQDAPDRETFLGLSDTCADCHFDEHRGQEGLECAECHGEKSFKPAFRFDHDNSDFPLTGKHAQVACESCHVRMQDLATPRAAFPQPVAWTFFRFVDIAHTLCTDCHEDPHEGQMGSACATCHTTRAWRAMTQTARDTGFHDRYRFQLRGGHVGVACQQCHGPFARQAAIFHGLAFDRCDRCHSDAHVGQLDREKKPASDCDRCHTVLAFKPTTYEADDHDPGSLRGSHSVVPCSGCHVQDPQLRTRVAQSVVRTMTQRRRPVTVSLARLNLEPATTSCEKCHRDPHDGQFSQDGASTACATCHAESSFSTPLFDHERDSNFPLRGRHKNVSCSSCHQRESSGIIRYRPLDKQCSACHEDVHAGQFARVGSRLPWRSAQCADCHTEVGFSQTTFAHNDPQQSRFPLTGQHTTVSCSSCHQSVQTDPDQRVTRYRFLPDACEGCHLDAHNGVLDALFSTSVSTQPGHTPCAQCHSVAGWQEATYRQHDQTDFPLLGGHAKAPCIACHPQSFTQAAGSGECDGCHQDPHAGQLGSWCSECHDATSWASTFTLDRHRSTNFPLLGAHALVPCAACHGNLNPGQLGPAPLRCDDCHLRDWQNTAPITIDHVASNLGQDCNGCHIPWAFAPARLPQHDTCFNIASGPHAGVGCRACHRDIAGLVANGGCGTGTATCTGCHAHAKDKMDATHVNIPGYGYQDTLCYACHRNVP